MATDRHLVETQPVRREGVSQRTFITIVAAAVITSMLAVLVAWLI